MAVDSRPDSAKGTPNPVKSPGTAPSINQNGDGEEKNYEDEEKLQDDLALAATRSNTPSHLVGIKLFLAMSAVSMIMLLVTLDISIISTSADPGTVQAIPQITSDFHRLEDVGWYVGAFLLSSATMQPLTGKLYTHFSTKWTYLIFVIIFETGSAVCGSASSSRNLIGGRALAGVGASGLINGAMTVIMGAAKPEKRPLYTGAAMGVGQMGIVIGPLLGGVLTDHATWRWCFYINLPIGGVAIAFLSLLTIPDQVYKPKLDRAALRALIPRFDLIGFALFAPASIMTLLALQFGSGSDYTWSDSQVIGLFCGAGATAIVFVFWERHMGPDAMIPGHLLNNRIVVCSAFFFGFLMTTNSVASNFMPMYLQSSKGLSPTMSGVYLLATILSQTIFVLLSGGLVTKFGYYIPWCVAAAAVSTVSAGLISTWTPSTSLGPIIGYQVLLGVRGAGMQMAIIAVQHCLPRKDVAIGNSIIVLAQNFFGAILVTVANVIFQETLKSEIRHNVRGVDPAAAIAAGGSAANVRALTSDPTARQALLSAYATGVSNIFYLLTAMCAVSLVACFGMGWVDLRVPNTPQDKAASHKKEETLDDKV
ncbi:putative arabinose efflux permease, MFS family [Geosmithia morbida]|uniref:Arabinose efflux permease, MFS family n=1 Tax=Geosmithia morbida TaxID=1094350 RepID=A0A9P4YZN7_9HYPO|nr:putative arabinose efflux permease, MFS family [Geosmithia morbida]KAF4125487.1 putative arabinose efflux permease, MFS family [Geosmithia morbida]